MKAWINELVKEKIGSEIKVEKNDFKMAIETFAIYMETIAQDINNTLKTCQQIVVENLEATRLKNWLIFQSDDELILSIDTPPTAPIQLSQGLSIILSHWSNKYK